EQTPLSLNALTSDDSRTLKRPRSEVTKLCIRSSESIRTFVVTRKANRTDKEGAENIARSAGVPFMMALKVYERLNATISQYLHKQPAAVSFNFTSVIKEDPSGKKENSFQGIKRSWMESRALALAELVCRVT
ncbi:uncharacterized, partial [Tachysurus ichikawai]